MLAAPAGTGALCKTAQAEGGAIPTTIYGKTGVLFYGDRPGQCAMDLHPGVKAAAAHVRRVYEIGVTNFDCAGGYWNGKSEESYGLGPEVRTNIFLNFEIRLTHVQEGEAELETTLRLMKSGHLRIWRMHSVQTKAEIGSRSRRRPSVIFNPDRRRPSHIPVLLLDSHIIIVLPR